MRRSRPGGSSKAVILVGAAAGLAGFAVAALLFAGPSRLRETTPVAVIRQTTDQVFGEEHGRSARSPREIPLRGWLDVAQRVIVLVARNRLMQESAAVTFYALLAIFPVLAATVSIYGGGSSPIRARSSGSSMRCRASYPTPH